MGKVFSCCPALLRRGQKIKNKPKEGTPKLEFRRRICQPISVKGKSLTDLGNEEVKRGGLFL